MSKVLLIWEMIPDEIQFFIFDEEEDKEVIGWIKESNGLFINGDELEDNHAIFLLNNYLGEISDQSLKTPIVNEKITSVYSCGFVY